MSEDNKDKDNKGNKGKDNKDRGVKGGMKESRAAFVEWQCQSCDDERVHVVLKERHGQAVLQCETCRTTVKATRSSEESLKVPVIISDMGSSRKELLDLYPDEHLEVGDQLFHEGHNLLVTALEVAAPAPSKGASTKAGTGASDGAQAQAGRETRRVPSAPADQLKNVWAKLFDRVRVGVSVNRGDVTTSGHFWCTPEEEIYVGDEVEMGNEMFVVIAIKTESTKMRDGFALAQAIRRLYCRPLRGQRMRRRRQTERFG